MNELGPWLDEPNIENDQIRRQLKDKLDYVISYVYFIEILFCKIDYNFY